jgi:predicted GNAT family acetyltransferase
MSWNIAKPDQLGDILEFLMRREHSCVPFVAHLMKDGEPSFPPKVKKRVFYLSPRRGSGEIVGLILQTAFGFVFPVLDTLEAERHPRLGELGRRLRKNFFHTRTIMGRDEDVRRVEETIGSPPDTRVTYYIMSLWGAPAPRHRPAFEGYTFRRAQMRDLDRLLPLQRAYEKEEVIVDDRDVNAGVVYHNMRSALEHHLTFVAERDGKPVAKASTNARGLTYDQIGGVYTIPEERNRGIAAELMRYLIADIRAAGKGSTLFVKQHNAAAIRMYENLGFERRNEFAISYYYP